MPYIALRTIDVAGGLKRHTGDVVPEAEQWKSPDLWERSGHVRRVPAEEIQDGRWIRADGGGQKVDAPTPQAGETASSPPSEDGLAVAEKKDTGVGEDVASGQLELGTPDAPGPRAETPPAGDVPQRRSRRRHHQSGS